MGKIIIFKNLREYIQKKFKRVIFLFKIINNGSWERVIDFTKIKKDGVDIKELLKCL